MKYESIIFDIDGTLWDSRSIIVEGYNQVLTAAGHEDLCVTVEDLKRLFGKTMKEIADIMLTSLPEEERYPLMEKCIDTGDARLLNDPCDIGYPGVKETLEELHKRYRLFIVSNSQLGYPETTMEKLGITHLFQGHLCFGNTGTDKGTTIRILMEQHSIENAVYIGDTQGDYEATLEAELPFIWCTFGFGKPEGYVAKVDAFEDLLNL